MRPLPNHKWWLRAHDREAVELVVVVVVVLEKVVVAVVAGAGVPVGSFCHPLGTTVSALRGYKYHEIFYRVVLSVGVVVGAAGGG